MDADRQPHRRQVLAYLQAQFPRQRWELALPGSGRGHETYLARSDRTVCFVKLGARLALYPPLAALGVTPPVLGAGSLEDGTTILVQRHVDGRIPSWQDFRDYLEPVAAILRIVHHSSALLDLLPPSPSRHYRDLAQAALARLRQKWSLYRPRVPSVTAEVDATLAQLETEIETFTGSGPVAAHQDPCNGNWLITADGTVFLVDLEMMAQDDPAHDLGALLWWYYPPRLRPRFLEQAGYDDTAALRRRMRVRMALHCLGILLPRPQSFDPFDARAFPGALRDFRAVASGRENPHGYED